MAERRAEEKTRAQNERDVKVDDVSIASLGYEQTNIGY
jgi:hypothetical protein